MLRKFLKTVACLFVFFIFIFSAQQVFANEWTKYEKNPIFTPTTDWDNHVAASAVIFDNNKYKMWYQGHGNDHWSIGYAESSDGIDWQRPVSNPVLSPKNENNITETSLVEPTVVKNDQYRMWFNSQNNTAYNIRYASSSDGINWVKHPAYVLRGESSWESQGVANPTVIYKDGKYMMWYMGWGSGPWKVGLAESVDGINWTKYQNNPLTLPVQGHVGGPSVVFFEGKFHMFYHTGDGVPIYIYHVISTDGINWSCDGDCLVLSTSGGFDSHMTVYPKIFNHDGRLYLYYTGHNGSLWQIGLATQQPIIQSKLPTVIIPGLFASWNKQAIVYNQTIDQKDWKINPFVHEYEGIKQTLINLGYQENKDFYVFAYDWRKGLDNLAYDLNNYLNQLSTNNQFPTTNFNIIGHSLGGLVARIYAQKYGTEKINKLITVGSPHQGAAQVYKAVEAGEIDRYDNFFWLSQKMLLQLYRDGIKTDKQIISDKIPIAKDLLPTYNFLKKENGQEISVQNMRIKNDTLLSYNPNLPNIFYSIVGEKGNTLSGYKVGPQTTFDRLLDYYPDGRPIENFFQIGDYVVLSSSAKVGENNKIFSLGHGEIIYKKEPIKEILNLLSVPYQENQIVEGNGTTISPSLLFLILSPAEMKVMFNNNTYIEKDGLILIENASSGNYQLELTGKEKGNYQVLIGQVGASSDQWSKIEGKIINDSPTDQLDKYQIVFDQNNPLDFPVEFNKTTEYFDRLINRLNELNLNIKNKDLKTAVNRLIEAKKDYLKKRYHQVKIDLEKAHQEIFQARRRVNLQTKSNLLDIIDQLENSYSIILKNSKLPVSEKKLKAKVILTKKTISLLQQYLLWQHRFRKNVTEKALLLKVAEEKLNKAEKNIKDKNYFYVEILIKSVELLLKEIK